MYNKFSFLNGARFLLVALSVIIGYSVSAFGQSNWMQEATQDGFWIKKVVSDTVIASGQPFTYTIYYSIPAGATNVSITDNLPAGVMFLSANYNNACGTPTVSSPTVNQMGGTYSLSWASVPNACTGSFSITVAFPNGVTCPGATVRNNVCIRGSLSGKQYDFCTGYVNTKATASNPWHINKYPIGASWQGGNCPYASGNDTLTYQVCVYKDFGLTGQLDLVSGVVTDTLPTGAVLVSSTCGATQSGNVIAWNVGNLSSNQGYNTVCCQFRVYYPSSLFPSGTNITNSATLSGQLGSPNQPCSSFSTTSNQTCVTLASFTTGSISKWVYTNRQPGCSGQYLIYVCNTGTTSITVNVLDTLPAQLTGFSLGGMYILSATLTGNIVSATGTLAAGQCGYIYVNFTIPANASVGSTITNCAHMTFSGGAPAVGCASFVVAAAAPTPCLWKEVCSKQSSYAPGSTFRYRLRVQNIGGLPMTGTTITDQLNSNLEYIGNPSFYIASSWNTPCTTSPANPWTGVNLTYNSGTNVVTAVLDTIPAVCQNIFYNACGMYGTGGVPYYFIEFDVKVRDTSALGNIPNSFNLAGGSLGTTTYTSNIEYVLVAGNVGFSLNKGVKKPNDPNYGTSATVLAGSTVNYKLNMNSTGTAALRYVTFADLLPRDAGAGDQKILQMCSARNSQFDVPYSSFITSSPGISQWKNGFTGGLANVNNLMPTGSPNNAFTIGCGTGGSWASSWVAGDKNLGAHFGSNAITTNASVEFAALVSSAAKPLENACNSFAASGFTKHLIQSNITSFQLAGQSESAVACIMIDSVHKEKRCLDSLIKQSIKCIGKNQNGNYEYAYSLTAISCVPGTITFSSPDGNFTPSTFNLTSNPWTINTTFEATSANNPVVFYFAINCADGSGCKDSIMYDLPECPQEHKPCLDSIIKLNVKCIGKNSNGDIEYGLQLVATSCIPSTLIISSPDGYFTPSTFSLNTSPWGINSTFVHTSANNPIMIYFTISCQGVKCNDSLRVDLPKCPDTPQGCCSKFIHTIKNEKIVWQNGPVSLSASIFAGPVSIKKFSATIVSAQLRRQSNPWDRIFGDITGGSLTVAPAPGPQLLSLFSREAIWGPGECIDWTKGANLSLNMIFPAPTNNSKNYVDTLRFSIRYSFTDCDCITCDTFVTYTIVRKWKFTPWDPKDNTLRNGNAGSGKSEKLQGEAPTETSIIMDDLSNGTLWIVSPDDPENDIVITGLEVNSTTVPNSEILNGDIVGTVQGTTSFVDANIVKGDETPITLKFDNANTIYQFPIYVKFAYQIAGFEETFFTEPIVYNARVPAANGDEMGIDKESKPEKLNTYALYVNNSNGYNEGIYAISIKTKGTAQVIAVGPPSSSDGMTFMFPYMKDDGSFMITVPSQGTAGFASNQKVKPIYLTISGIDETSNEIEFVTYDRDGQVISTGVVMLSDPISGVNDNGGGINTGAFLNAVTPNPASNKVSLSFTINDVATNTALSIIDMRGKEVMGIFNNARLEHGAYIEGVDISHLPAGSYIITLRTDKGIVTKSLSIVR